MPSLQSAVREHRLAHKLSQQELATQIGISRQALGALEAGRAVPGTDVALRLARVLGCKVEALFTLADTSQAIEATLAAGARIERGTRLTLAEIDGKWVAHPIDPRRRESLTQAADGLATRPPRGEKTPRVRVEPLRELETARQRLIVMGCAPALGALAARLGSAPAGVQVTWLPGASGAALAALGRGEVHVAGIHLRDEATGELNLPFVRRHFPGRAMCVFTFASWEQGILVARGNPHGIRGAVDLLRRDLRLIRREPGAGAHTLLEQALREKGARLQDVPDSGCVALGHMEVAEAIALGAADAGIAIRSAALAHGLGFIPLAAERFDLVFSRELGADPRIERLVEALGSRGFRRELESIGGYETGTSGQQVAEVRGPEGA